jgi:uncharacterized protein (DUF433 family)
MSNSTPNDLHTTSGSDGLNGQGIVMRTDIGPAIAGTRISIYDIMDYLHESWSPQKIRDWLGLTESQMTNALTYIGDNRVLLEREHRELEREAEENRRYWEEFNRNRPRPEPAPDTPQKAALRARLEAWKSRLPNE